MKVKLRENRGDLSVKRSAEREDNILRAYHRRRSIVAPILLGKDREKGLNDAVFR
jgi:hypothetical protein